MLLFLGAAVAFGAFVVWLMRLEIRLLVVAAALALCLIGLLVAGAGWVGDRALRPHRPEADWPRDLARSAREPGAWAFKQLNRMLNGRGNRRAQQRLTPIP